MREGTRTGRAWLLAALALAGPCAAAAQDTPPSSYQLPPASPTPDPRLQGPVVEDHPVAGPTTSTPATPEPDTPPTAAPVITQRTAPPATRAPMPSTAPSPTPPRSRDAAPLPAPSPQPQATATTTAPPPDGSASAAASEPVSAPAPPSRDTPGESWPWYAAALALASGIAAGLFRLARRRRDRGSPAVSQQSAEAPSPPAATLTPSPRPAPVPPVRPTAAAPVLTVTLEVRRFSATLVNASLDYRLRVVNTGALPLADIIIGGDMIGAHASLPPEAQFAHDGAALEARHRIATLGPGESAELSGTLRLPLAGAAAIRRGTAALFVPLVRLCARAGADGPSFASTHVVGEVPARPGGGLRPFRLDLGPRIYPDVAQRKLAIPA